MSYKKFLVAALAGLALPTIQGMKVAVNSDDEVTSSDTTEGGAYGNTSEVNQQLLEMLAAVKGPSTREEQLAENRRLREAALANRKNVYGKAPMLVVENGVIQKGLPKPPTRRAVESTVFATSDIADLEKDLAFMAPVSEVVQAKERRPVQSRHGVDEDADQQKLSAMYDEELHLSDEELYSQTLVDLPVVDGGEPARFPARSRVEERLEEAEGHQPLLEVFERSAGKKSPRDVKKSRAVTATSKKPLPVPGGKGAKITIGRSAGKKGTEKVAKPQISEPIAAKKTVGYDDSDALNSLKKVWLTAFSLHQEKMQDWRAAGKEESEFDWVQFPNTFEAAKPYVLKAMQNQEYQDKVAANARAAKLWIEEKFWDYLETKLEMMESYVEEVRK